MSKEYKTVEARDLKQLCSFLTRESREGGWELIQTFTIPSQQGKPPQWLAIVVRETAARHTT